VSVDAIGVVLGYAAGCDAAGRLGISIRFLVEERSGITDAAILTDVVWVSTFE
jgi:hypothetical protein